MLSKKKAVTVRVRGAESKTEEFCFQGVTRFQRVISSLLRVILGVCEHIIRPLGFHFISIVLIIWIKKCSRYCISYQLQCQGSVWIWHWIDNATFRNMECIFQVYTEVFSYLN